MNIVEVENFNITNASLVVDYFINGRYQAESFPIDEFHLFIESNNYLQYHDFKIKHDNQYEEIDGQVSWERYTSEFVFESDVCDFLKHKLKEK